MEALDGNSSRVDANSSLSSSVVFGLLRLGLTIRVCFVDKEEDSDGRDGVVSLVSFD